MKSVLAGVYRILGVDPNQSIVDHNGRPQMILDEPEPLAGLLA
jgi:hypothetical protein